MTQLYLPSKCIRHVSGRSLKDKARLLWAFCVFRSPEQGPFEFPRSSSFVHSPMTAGLVFQIRWPSIECQAQGQGPSGQKS